MLSMILVLMQAIVLSQGSAFLVYAQMDPLVQHVQQERIVLLELNVMELLTPAKYRMAATV